VRTIFLWRGTPISGWDCGNFGDRAADLRLVIPGLTATCRSVRVRGLRRARRGVLTRRLAGPDQVLAELSRARRQDAAYRLTFDPPPAKLAVNAASYGCRSPPARAAAVRCDCLRPDRPAPDAVSARPAGARRELRAVTLGETTVESSNDSQ